MTTLDYIKLVNKKLECSYAPYSNFPVASLIVTKDNKLIYGVNVENAAYGSTICAERNALTSFITEGYKYGDVKYLFITSNGEGLTYPCGSCRQVMSEFLDLGAQIIITNYKEEYIEVNMNDILPYSFTKINLGV